MRGSEVVDAEDPDFASSPRGVEKKRLRGRRKSRKAGTATPRLLGPRASWQEAVERLEVEMIQCAEYVLQMDGASAHAEECCLAFLDLADYHARLYLPIEPSAYSRHAVAKTFTELFANAADTATVRLERQEWLIDYGALEVKTGTVTPTDPASEHFAVPPPHVNCFAHLSERWWRVHGPRWTVRSLWLKIGHWIESLLVRSERGLTYRSSTKTPPSLTTPPYLTCMRELSAMFEVWRHPAPTLVMRVTVWLLLQVLARMLPAFAHDKTTTFSLLHNSIVRVMGRLASPISSQPEEEDQWGRDGGDRPSSLQWVRSSTVEDAAGAKGDGASTLHGLGLDRPLVQQTIAGTMAVLLEAWVEEASNVLEYLHQPKAWKVESHAKGHEITTWYCALPCPAGGYICCGGCTLSMLLCCVFHAEPK